MRSRSLADVKECHAHFDIRVTVLGHLQRGGSPSVQDRVLASKLGVAAVEELCKGAHDAMVGEMNGRIVLTPFQDAIGKRRRLDPDLLRILPILSV